MREVQLEGTRGRWPECGHPARELQSRKSGGAPESLLMLCLGKEGLAGRVVHGCGSAGRLKRQVLGSPPAGMARSLQQPLGEAEGTHTHVTLLGRAGPQQEVEMDAR